MRETKTPCPKKLSKAIRMALIDQVAAERTEDLRIDMDLYHAPRGHSCRVCFAGAVMHKRFDLPNDFEVTPCYFAVSQDWTNVFYALNYVRMGDTLLALVEMGLSSKGIRDMKVTEYKVDRKKFRADMEKVIKKLEAKGL